MWRFLQKLSSPKYFYDIAGKLIPWFATAAILLFIAGLIGSLVLAPPDYQQGDGFRIIYIHVPSAFLSLSIYTVMAISSVIGLVWRIKLAHMITRASAPIGAWITFLALFTGSVWGKPMWGTWWVWDARLTSELILLFLYLGYLALQTAIPERLASARAGAILVLVGFVDIPIIHFSVDWWNTLHQGASLSLLSQPTISSGMLYPLLIMIAAFFLFYATILLMRTRCEVIDWEQQSHWVQCLVAQ